MHVASLQMHSARVHFCRVRHCVRYLRGSGITVGGSGGEYGLATTVECGHAQC